MSPAPYPPMQVGDDVDASFFDQLGDELDIPVSEVFHHKPQDAGNVGLPAAPESGELLSSASGSWINKQKLQAEGHQYGQQDDNAQLDFELDDALSELSISRVDSISGRNANSADFSCLGNGDVHAESSEMKSVPSLAPTAAHSNGECEPESSREDPVQDNGDVETSTSLDNPGEDIVLRDSDFSKEVATPPTSETSSSTVKEETSRESVSDKEVNPAGASKPQIQTVTVTEVQWSDFGASAGFGSFSDLFSALPADSSQQQVETYSSGADFFQLTADAPLDFGSYPAQHLVNSGVLEVPQANSETQAFTPQISPELPTLGQERQTSVLSSSEESSTYLQSQGQEQQTHSEQVYQGEWQNPYPGWWYSVITGEWRQETCIDGGAGAESALDSQGQYQIEGQTGNEQVYWPTQESGLQSSQTSGQIVYGNGDVLANPSVAGAYQNEWNEPDQSISGQSKLTDNPLFEEAAVQQNDSLWQSNGNTGAVQQSTSWEDQYPGWYYDYQAQEWKQTDTPAPGSGLGISQVFDVQQETLPSEPSAERGTSYAESQSQGYSSVRWPTMQDQQGTSATQYTQEGPSSHDIMSNSLHFDSSSSSSSAFPSIPNATVTEVVSRQWTGAQSNVQFGNSSSPYQVEQLPIRVGLQKQDLIEQSPLKVLNQQQNSYHEAPYNSQHSDPQIAPQQHPESPLTAYSALPAPRFMSQEVSNYAPQIPRQQTPDIYYNQVPAHQVPSFATHTWPTVGSYQVQQQPVGNSYHPQHHSHYDPLTPPKSTVEALRTSVGRPPHVLTTFGFGGKLVVMKLKDPVSLHASDGKQSISTGQAWVPGPIHVHSLSQIVAQGADHGRPEPGNLYFSSLTRQTFSGPLAGGSVSNKELSKWLEERGANCHIEEPDCKNPGSLSMLWGLLKVACQHYGKLRSAVGTTGITSQEDDGPEGALANLLTAGTNQGPWTMGSFASTVCLQPVPSEHQLQTTASEVKKLLVMGKRKEALKHALQGQLWGPALVLARQLGEKFYTDAVAQMAQCQFLPGSPLRTLSLLIAGQPAEVFSEKIVPVTLGTNSMQNFSTSGASSQDGLGGMLEEWQENLSIMAANRTIGDDRVISHLGDCLWKVKGEVTAAHICYLVADANFESFTSTARLCLIGADHWQNPRTFATPEAIQRTEVYEYSKVLGNPQFILVSFQPYKLVYASMLAEAGKSSEALRYCQAVLKTLKTASRAPEVETCRQAAIALEERLRIHTQGGHAVSLAPGKIVRNLFNALDRGIHGIIGGPPQSSDQAQHNSKADMISSTQDPYSSSLAGVSPGRTSAPMVPSLSAEKLKDVKKSMPPRSVSEPDFFSPSMKGKSVGTKANTGAAAGYLGRLSSTLFQKAGGIVGFRKKEAKLGEKNKFYFDERLKQWVEEGVEPVEEVAPPPPPTATFVNRVEEPTTDIHTGVGAGPSVRPLSGTPPVPPSNQFSARTKQGVRSRYVDTFNKGGNATPSRPVAASLFPTVKVAGAPMQPMSFFVPGPSLDNSGNGSLAKSENGTVSGNSEEGYVGIHSGSAFRMEDRIDSSQSTGAQNSIQQDATMTSALHRVASAGNTSAFRDTEPVEGNDRAGGGTSNGGMGLANGYHTRSNSWSGYPSDFQTSQSVAEPTPNLLLDNFATVTSYSVYNGFSSHSSTTSTPAASSYFPSAAGKVDAYYSNPGDASSEPSLPPLPSIEPFTASLGSGVSDGRGAGQAPVSLVGDDLQEVEF